MKIIIFILAICPFFSFAQSSFPTISTNPSWRIEKGNFFGIPNFVDYSFGNDIVIDGKHYQEIIAIYSQNSQSVVEGYIRSENKKVYIITFDPWNRGSLSKEKLMYDFSLEINKKIYCAANSLENPTDSTLCWAVSTDSISYRGIKRKTWNMRYSEKTPNPNDPPNNVQAIWIEGIGSTAHPFFPLYCISSGCEASSTIVCFHESSILKFISPLYSSCDTRITDIKESITQEDVKLYPTLSSCQLTVENNHLNNLKIQIRNSLGQLFISNQVNIGTNLIDITSLASGIYFALISDGTKKRVEKFVKK
jgi:Secretion system C-terminal sorting domain